MMTLPIDRPSPRPRAYPRKAAPVRLLPAPKPLDAERQKLALSQMHLAYKLAWWFARNTARDVPADELISEAMYGLVYAAGRYQEGRHVPFSAYANMVIRHRLIQAVIRWRDRRMAPLPEWIEANGNQWEAEDHRPTLNLCNRAAANELCNRVRWALPARWYKALRLYYCKGLTLGECGQRMGISRQRVAQVILKASSEARRLVAVDMA